MEMYIIVMFNDILNYIHMYKYSKIEDIIYFQTVNVQVT